MTKLEFVLEIVELLAWPVVVITLAVLFRNPLSKVLLKLTKVVVKYKDLEAGFESLGAAAREADIELEPVPDVQLIRDPLPLVVEAHDLVSDHPETAIAIAWQAVEVALWGTIERLGISANHPQGVSAFQNVKLLQEAGQIEAEMAEFINRMGRLRNAAAHLEHPYKSIQPKDAKEFIAVTSGVVSKLQNLKRRP